MITVSCGKYRFFPNFKAKYWMIVTNYCGRKVEGEQRVKNGRATLRLRLANPTYQNMRTWLIRNLLCLWLWVSSALECICDDLNKLRGERKFSRSLEIQKRKMIPSVQMKAPFHWLCSLFSSILTRTTWKVKKFGKIIQLGQKSKFIVYFLKLTTKIKFIKIWQWECQIVVLVIQVVEKFWPLI